MITLTPTRRRVARDLARAGTVVSAALFAVSFAQATWLNVSVSAAAINAGAVQVLAVPGSPTAGQPLARGGSATVFALTPPVGASCTGDTVSGEYGVHSYIVPASVDPATLTFGPQGPLPAGTGANLRQPLFSGAGSPIVDKTTAVASIPGGPGLLTGMPTSSFGVFGAAGPQVVPAGTYNIGFACTRGLPSATQLDKYWNAQLTFSVDSTDKPSGIKWTAVVGSTPATTTTTAPAVTTTTVASGVTTTTVKSGIIIPTTTTVKSGTTTTVESGVTTTTVKPAATTTTVVGGATTTTVTNSAGVTTPSGSSSSSGLSTPATGAAPIPMAIWALLFLVFGRMAILLGRPVRIIR